jgi:hypothetical protein
MGNCCSAPSNVKRDPNPALDDRAKDPRYVAITHDKIKESIVYLEQVQPVLSQRYLEAPLPHEKEVLDSSMASSAGLKESSAGWKESVLSDNSSTVPAPLSKIHDTFLVDGAFAQIAPVGTICTTRTTCTILVCLGVFIGPLKRYLTLTQRESLHNLTSACTTYRSSWRCGVVCRFARLVGLGGASLNVICV